MADEANPSVPDVPADPTALSARFQAFRSRHARWEHALFFAAGFGFDILMLGRIDRPRVLVQQGLYLLLLGWLVALDVGQRPPPPVLQRFWRFREDATHFLLGSLLSLYTLFYFKSSAHGLSAVFAALMFALLVANELPRFRQRGPMVRVGLCSFCLTSYLAYLLPVVAGWMSPWLFALAVTLSFLCILGLTRLTRTWTGKWRSAMGSVLLPGMVVQVALLTLYLFRLVPPVPLSVPFIGVYHDVQRIQTRYRLRGEEQPGSWWPFAAPTLHLQEGERIYVFARIFAPGGFRDRIQIRWEHERPDHGWRTTDVVPMTITGGREDGYAGYAYKQNHEPGRWRVRVETEDGRDIGFLTFHLENEPNPSRRVVLEQWR